MRIWTCYFNYSKGLSDLICAGATDSQVVDYFLRRMTCSFITAIAYQFDEPARKAMCPQSLVLYIYIQANNIDPRL